MPDTAPENVAPSDAIVATSPNGTQGRTLDWSFNPWRQDWRRPVAALAICVAVSVLAAWWARTPLWAIIAFALLTATNAVIFLPVRYRLDGQGVTVWLLGAPSFRAWAHYRNSFFPRYLVSISTLPT